MASRLQGTHKARATRQKSRSLRDNDGGFAVLFFFWFFPPLQLARVDERVLLHVGLLVEPLAAELAGVGPGVGVDEQVRGQGGRPLEAFAADLAVEASFL